MSNSSDSENSKKKEKNIYQENNKQFDDFRQSSDEDSREIFDDSLNSPVERGSLLIKTGVKRQRDPKDVSGNHKSRHTMETDHAHVEEDSPHSFTLAHNIAEDNPSNPGSPIRSNSTNELRYREEDLNSPFELLRAFSRLYQLRRTEERFSDESEQLPTTINTISKSSEKGKEKATDIVDKSHIKQTHPRQESVPSSQAKGLEQPHSRQDFVQSSLDKSFYKPASRSRISGRPKKQEPIDKSLPRPLFLLRRKNRHLAPDEPEETLSSISYHSDTDFSRLDHRFYSYGSSESDRPPDASLDGQSILGELGDLPHGWQSPFQEDQERSETSQLPPQPSLVDISLDAESQDIIEPRSQEDYGYDEMQDPNIHEEIDFPGFDDVITGREESHEQIHDKLSPEDLDIFQNYEQPRHYDRVLPSQRFTERKIEERVQANLDGVKIPPVMAIGNLMQRRIFSRFTDKKIEPGAVQKIIEASELFFEQMADDLKAYTKHASRKKLTCEDMKLLMKRQRLLTGKRTLEVVAHEYLPRELYDLVCISATADNELYPESVE
ncbi:hypothetical protein J3Q64DRAFT_1695994 [Phycomyces blakesleeanus]